MSSNASNLLGAAPVFIVKDIFASGDYYQNILGFCFDQYWGDPPIFCMPGRDGCIVMLQQATDETKIQPNHKVNEDLWDAYFWLRDADALFEEFKAKGALIEYEPCIQKAYQMKEFAVRDLDGYILAFGQDWSEQLK